MLINIVSWTRGSIVTSINDTTNYSAWFPAGQPAGFEGSPNFSPRANVWPLLSNIEINGTTLSFHIECKGTIHSQYETLKSLFRIADTSLGTLIVSDAADSSRQWYVKGRPISNLSPAGEDTAGEYVMTLALEEPLWRTVTSSTTSWSVTASGQTKALTVLGNYPARPSLSITIGGARAGGYINRLWKPYYNPLTVENKEPHDITNGGWNTQTLIQDSTVSNQVNSGAIGSGTLSIPIDTSVGGGLVTTGGMCWVVSTGEQIYYTGISAGTMTVYNSGGVTGRGWGGTTAAAIADNVVLRRSQMMANGKDVRLQVDKNFVDIWVGGGGWNSTTTEIWYNPKYAPLVSMPVATSISNATAAPFTVTVAKTAANATALKALPSTFMIQVDTEIFFCSTPNPTAYTFLVTARAQRGTSAGTHAVAAVMRYIEHDNFLLWGSPLDAGQAVDSTRKPIFNLTTSTNTSWVFADFYSEDGLRTGAWVPSPVSTLSTGYDTPSGIYTDTIGTSVDPAAVLGFTAKSFLKNNVQTADTFKCYFILYHPAGFTTVTVSGNKRRALLDWPTVTGLHKSQLGGTYAVVFNDVKPTLAATTQALAAHAAVALSTGTWRYLRYAVVGTIAKTATNEIYYEWTDATMVITSANVLQSALTVTSESNYYLDAAISVSETGDAIYLFGTCKVGSVIVLDCDAETITTDGIEGGIDVDWNTNREGWLDLPSPQQSATCTLVYTETGAASLTIVPTWKNRNTL